MRRNYVIIFIGLLCGLLSIQPATAQHRPGQSGSQAGNIEAYIEQYKTLAIREMARTGVPAAISLAQGIVESGAGTSWLSVHANNQFGIKCKSHWQGERVFHHDDRRNECFRKYNSAAASWRDHSNFLKSSSRYSFLFYLDPLDYKAWAYGLKQAGYATSNRYARQLIRTIQTYDLNQYSQQGLALSKKEQPESEFATLLNKKIEQEQPRPEPQKPAMDHAQDKEATAAYPAHLFQINKRAVLYLPKGTQLIAIAEQFDVPLRRILRYNELKTDVLPRGMLVFIEKKRKKGDHASHVVQAGETYHEIAQEEGIRLKWLLKRNHLNANTLPQPGTVLVLKGYADQQEDHRKPGGFFSRLFGGKTRKTAPHPVADNRKNIAPAKSPSTSGSKRNAIFVYDVRPGDTLYGIARKFNVPIERIRQLNNIKGDLIKTGQKLRIPKK